MKINQLTGRLKSIRKAIALTVCAALYAQVSMAQGAAALSDATATIRNDWMPVLGGFVMAVGGIIGTLGAIRIYQKWSGGDHDIQKELINYGGSGVFLLLSGSFISGLFSL